MVKITGLASALSRIRSVGSPEMKREVGAALVAAGKLIEVEAAVSISRGSQGGKGHKPSRPGQPPMGDTGFLAKEIETVQVEPLKVEVSSNAPYSAALEYGTSKMAERPFMRPAAKKMTPKARELVARAVRKVAAGRRVTGAGKIGG